MKLTLKTPRQALNKAFMKVKPTRVEIENFKTNLISLLDGIREDGREEFNKNVLSDFLKDTYYKQIHSINTKDDNDLVIHNGLSDKTPVGVIIETKRPSEKAHMVSKEKLNVKAFHELVLYYLRERVTLKNLEVKHLIITNINEWYIFDATLFERLFAQNKKFVEQFIDFEARRLADFRTDFFYKQIAEPFISSISSEVECVYFNVQDYQMPLRNADKSDDNVLIALFKVLSPVHLLKQTFANDSNTLDKSFYSELLHIIGLQETKSGSKKLIERRSDGDRHSGSIIEDAIIQLDSLDKLSRLKNPSRFGITTQERLFNVALALSITWINRILFLKLLEAQLITYHKGNADYSFLNSKRIKSYDDLNGLFFQVLAKKQEDRNSDVKNSFDKVPYLNSSLFEPTDVEQVTLFISNLKDDKEIPLYSQTVLKTNSGKRRSGSLSTLEYLFEFLNAYDFTSEGSEDIQEENKTLINASVLGLIFEKINGYKDGSFFTPGFITMYMCRETIRKAIVQKFNEVKNWQCKDIKDLYNKIEDRDEANKIVNSITICDPAVGSGHFLVSSLNEILAVKNELNIFQDREGKRLKECQIEVINDELIVTDEDGKLFEYNPKNKESQRIQETLFHEKQSIIENCLFGVDINPNSVKICRLRLWIELLKNAYYKNATELETLPNIDINIKCGNSLISRFAIDADITQALKKSKWKLTDYRNAVSTYRNAQSKDQKREMEQLIADIKTDFRSEISSNDPKVIKFRKLSNELYQMNNQTQLFEMTKKEKAEWNKKHSKLSEETQKLEVEIETIKSNKIYENAFEWRFEFPEVLDENGDYIGFDVVIGNPPYIFSREHISTGEKNYFNSKFKLTQFKLNTYVLFSELSTNLQNKSGNVALIIPNNWLTLQNSSQLREFILGKYKNIVIINDKNRTFEDASVDASILMFSQIGVNNLKAYNLEGDNFLFVSESDSKTYLNENGSVINFQINENSIFSELISKIDNQSKKLDQSFEVNNGVQAYTVGEGKPKQTKEMKDNRVYHSRFKVDETWVKYCESADIIRYGYNWTGQYIKYGENLSRRRIPELFKGERIFVRQIPANMPFAIVSSLITNEFVCDNNYMIIREKANSDVSIKTLLGLINSRLVSFWFYSTYAKHQRKIFPQFKVKELQNFPIPNKLSEIRVKVEKYIDEIYGTVDPAIKSKNSDKIDCLIYRIYSLTIEEVKIIDPEFSLSSEEYEAVSVE